MTSRITAQQLTQWLGQPLRGGTPSDVKSVGRVNTDTRTIAPGDLFVALCGERFDANEFLQQARDKGAVAAICQGESASSKLAAAGLPGWVVEDTRLALGQIATHYRAQFSLPLIAVTGSNGKTTVTQMVASILRAHCGDASLATQGNFNNDIGVPLTLLRLASTHTTAVVELGMNHPGEISQLAAMAQPTVALVNNAQREHLEFMETVEAVAHENGSVIEALGPHGVAVFPADDAYTGLWAKLAGDRRTLRFAVDAQTGADIYVVNAEWLNAAWQVCVATPAGTLRFALHIAGAHNVKNALAAVACALASGVSTASIERGLSGFESVKGRSRAQLLHHRGRTITLIDDTYNANPDSVRAAIDVLAALPGPRLLVLGDMGEVGDQGPVFHAEAGQYAQQKHIEKMVCTGDLSVNCATHFEASVHLEDMDAVCEAVVAQLPWTACVLVKGSRFMKMERVVQAIAAAADPVESKAVEEFRSVSC